MKYTFSDVLKRWQGESGWVYVLLPTEYWDELRTIGGAHKRGFGSIKVIATVGSTSWNTSIFPDTERKQFILFIKKPVRSKENMEIDQTVDVEVVVE